MSDLVKNVGKGEALDYLDRVCASYKSDKAIAYARELTDKILRWDRNLVKMGGTAKIVPCEEGHKIQVTVTLPDEYAKYAQSMSKMGNEICYSFLAGFVSPFIKGMNTSIDEAAYITQRSVDALIHGEKDEDYDVWSSVIKIPSILQVCYLVRKFKDYEGLKDNLMTPVLRFEKSENGFIAIIA